MKKSPKSYDISKSVQDLKVDVITDKNPEYILYWQRWLILLTYALNASMSTVQWLQYAVIQDAIVRYYGTSSRTVNWTALVYMVVYPPLVFPAMYILDKLVS